MQQICFFVLSLLNFGFMFSLGMILCVPHDSSSHMSIVVFFASSSLPHASEASGSVEAWCMSADTGCCCCCIASICWTSNMMSAV